MPTDEAELDRRTIVKYLTATSMVGAGSLAGCSKKNVDPSGNNESGDGTATDAKTTSQDKPAGAPKIPSVPDVGVSFGHEPFLDHTQAILGLKNNWFDDVGITIQPEDSNGKNAGTGDAPAFLGSGSADIVSGSVGLYAPSLGNYPDIRMMNWADLFKGFAIMAQPDEYTTYWEFRDQGLGEEKAMGKTVSQLTEGKLLLSDAPVIQGFVEVALGKADLSLDELDVTVQDPGQHVATMEADRADFEVGGAPYQVTLRRKGYDSLIDAGVLAANATPSRDSEELTVIFRDGWMSTKSWIENNWDSALRMAAVNFKICEYISEQPKQAAKQHIPFLNQLAGTDLTVDEGVLIYEKLDPFYTFEEQKSWFHDEDDPLYHKHQMGAWIDQWVSKDVLDKDKWNPDNIQMCTDVYYKLEEHQAAADEQLSEAESKIADAPDNDARQQAKELLSQANDFYDLYDFLDADRFSVAAIECAEYAKEES